MIDQLLGDDAMRQCAAGHLAHALAVGLSGLRRQVGVVDGVVCPPSLPEPLANSEPCPTARRSWYSCRDATAQPPSTSPTTASSPTSTPSRNSSQNSEPPFTCVMRRNVIPGCAMGTRNMVRPSCLGTSQLVRARHNP